MTAQHTQGALAKIREAFAIALERIEINDYDGEESEWLDIVADGEAAFRNDLSPLIAAGPAMLAALQLAEGWIDAEREGEETGEGQQARWILDTIRAAIAAATGSPTGGTEAPAASPTDETGDDCEAIRTLEQAAACVRDGLVLLDAVEYVDDHALEDGRLCVVPAEGPAFRVEITMGER